MENNSEQSPAKEPEEIPVKFSYQLYSSTQIGLACFFATPFAALLMLGLNFKSIGNNRNYKFLLLTSFLTLPFLFWFITQMLNKNYYRILIFVVAGIMAAIADGWQGEIYKNHIENGGENKSYLRVFGVIISSLLIIFVGLIIFSIITGINL